MAQAKAQRQEWAWCVEPKSGVWLERRVVGLRLGADHTGLYGPWCRNLCKARGKPLCLVTQLFPTLCNPVDCSPPGSSVHGDSPGKNAGVGCHAFFQAIFSTQVSNQGLLCLLHWQMGSLPLCHLGSPHMVLCETERSRCWTVYWCQISVGGVLEVGSHKVRPYFPGLFWKKKITSSFQVLWKAVLPGQENRDWGMWGLGRGEWKFLFPGLCEI